MDRVPTELMHVILEELDMNDVCQLSRTNHKWYQLCVYKLYHSPPLDNAKRHKLFFKCITPRTQTYLRHLSLLSSLITNEQLSQLTGCTGLITFRLSHCPHILPECINIVLGACVTSIQRIYLADAKLSQTTLQILGKACHQFKLWQIDLSNTMIQPCNRIDTSHHLDALMHDSDHPSTILLDLNLSYCNWVDDITLVNISNGLPFLKSLRLNWCQYISTVTLMEMILHLKQLSTLDVCHVPCLDNSSVQRLLTLNPFLESIRFTHHFQSLELIRSSSTIVANQ